MAYASDMRKGNVIKFKDRLYTVFESQLVTPGRYKAFVQTKLRDIVSGTMISYKFFSDEKIEIVRLEERTMEYLYEEDGKYYFMDVENYEQIFLEKEQLSDYIDFLVPQIQFKVFFYDEKPVFAEPPTKVNMKVISTEMGIKGDTVSNVMKPAVLESNLKINVPLFINEGDIIVVDTRTKEYVERVSKSK
ncbi:MAG TPA: elongation factor P [bacterium]|nr:elongation factor P [bacterium]HOL48334.1 elongation factor P [bacterium]HPQ19849.1 elongation factor P [bacterium]